MADLHARQHAQLHRLLGQRIGPGNDRLTGDDRGHGGQQHDRQHRPCREQQIERVLHCRGVFQDQRALPEIGQKQRGKGHEQPCHLNRLAAEMAHIGVKRLGPGHRQKDRAQHDHPKRAVMQDEIQRMDRVQRRQHLGCLHHPVDAARRHDQKPDQRDRAKEPRHRLGPAILHQKQRDDDDDGHGHDIGLDPRGHELQPLECRQDRNRRGDGGVAVKQRRADHAQNQHPEIRPPHGALRKRQQRKRAALALVICAQQDQDVFHRHDQDQRPDDQRQHAQHILALDAAMAGAGRMHRLAKGVKRRGADIAVNHADGRQRQRQKARALVRLRLVLGIGGGLGVGNLGVQTGHISIPLRRNRPGRGAPCRMAA